MLVTKESSVMQIKVLDENGMYMHRAIFLLKDDDKFLQCFKNVLNDKSIKNSYTTTRKVVYE